MAIGMANMTAAESFAEIFGVLGSLTASAVVTFAAI